MIYRQGPFHVTVEADGAIQVKHGDWISKYSAAMYNDFFKGWDEFGRLGPGGIVQPLKNADLIYTGETVYHIPTWRRSRGKRDNPPGPGRPEVIHKGLRDAVYKAIAEDIGLEGDRYWEIFEKVDWGTHGGLLAIEFAEMCHLLVEGGLVMTAGAIADIALLPIFMAAGFWHETHEDERLVESLAYIYTTTAWAFDDKLPPAIVRPYRKQSEGGTPMDFDQRERYEEIWREHCEETVRSLQAWAAKENYHERALQMLMRVLSRDDRKELAEALRKGVQSRFGGSNRQLLASYVRQYPPEASCN